MIRAHLLHDGGQVESDLPIDTACRPHDKATVWVDMLAPTDTELALLSTRWGFHALAIEDVAHVQKRSKYERYPSHAFVVTQALDRSTPEDPLDTVPISIFLRPGLVVSVRPKEVAAIAHVDRALQMYPERVGTHAARVLHAILDAVIDDYTHTMYSFEERVDALEAEAGTHEGPELVHGLVRVRRDLLMLRRMTLPQLELVRRFVDTDDPDLAEARIWFRDVLDHTTIISDQCTLLLDICNGALQVHSNSVNERLNKVMKYMAIVSTLMLPMTVISGTFGMNFDVIPIAHQVHGFWLAIGLMVGSAAVLLVIFRYRRWF